MPGNTVGTDYPSVPADLGSEARLQTRAFHPWNTNQIVAEGDKSKSVTSLEATFEQFTATLPIEVQLAKNFGHAGADPAADELADFIFGSDEAADLIVQYSLTPTDVANRKSALKTALRSAFRNLSDSAVNGMVGVSGANYAIRVGSNNPARSPVVSFLSEIPEFLEAGAVNVLDPNEDLTAVHHFFKFNWNSSGAAELALDAYQPLFQNGSVSGILEELEDFVFLESAVMTIPASHQADGFTFTGKLETEVSGISFNVTVHGSVREIGVS